MSWVWQQIFFDFLRLSSRLRGRIFKQLSGHNRPALSQLSNKEGRIWIPAQTVAQLRFCLLKNGLSRACRQRKSIGDVAGFMASSAWLPMPDKGRMFKLNSAA